MLLNIQPKMALHFKNIVSTLRIVSRPVKFYISQQTPQVKMSFLNAVRNYAITSSLMTKYGIVNRNALPVKSVSNISHSTLLQSTFSREISTTNQNMATLNQVRRGKVRTKKRFPKPKVAPAKRILFGPQRKGICVKCVVRTPRKPNSAKRKCAVLRLNNGKLITAYIPGERANLQEHGVVLFRGGRVQDCPGLKYKIIRGKFDIN